MWQLGRLEKLVRPAALCSLYQTDLQYRHIISSLRKSSPCVLNLYSWSTMQGYYSEDSWVTCASVKPSASLQFHVWNYLVFFPNYFHKIFDHLLTFIRLLPKDYCQKLDTPIIESDMLLRTILQASIDAAAGTAVLSPTLYFLRQFYWLPNAWHFQRE